MLSDILSQRQCFKLVCGAGNENADEINKLIRDYALAGANYFDVSANLDVVLAAKDAIAFAKKATGSKQYYLNVSVGIKGDPHTSKARIQSSSCTNCRICVETCSVQHAIKVQDIYTMPYVASYMCVGCGKCKYRCPSNAIEMMNHATPLEKILPVIVSEGIDSIELHANFISTKELLDKWQYIQSIYTGMLSFCTDQSNLGDNQLLERIELLIDKRNPFSTIIQADGFPMNGGDSSASGTLQALAVAQIVERKNFPIYLIMSGGTNIETIPCLKRFNLHPHGLAFGSYARKKYQEYDSLNYYVDTYPREAYLKDFFVAPALRGMQ